MRKTLDEGLGVVLGERKERDVDSSRSQRGLLGRRGPLHVKKNPRHKKSDAFSPPLASLLDTHAQPLRLLVPHRASGVS